MTTKIGQLGGVTVVDPEQKNYTPSALDIAATARTLNGTLITHWAAAKTAWTVPWRGLTSAEHATLWAELVRTQDLVWVPPEGGSFNVRVMSKSWHKETGSLYAVNAVLEQV